MYAMCLNIMPMLDGFLGWHLRNGDLEPVFAKHELPQVLEYS